MPSKIKNFVKFSLMLADTARQISLFYFKKKVSVINKNKFEFDPVTIADIKIQKKLNQIILETFPNHSIFGEEESFVRDGEYGGALIQLLNQIIYTGYSIVGNQFLYQEIRKLF